MSGAHQYGLIPALRFRWLTPAYDLVVRLTARAVLISLVLSACASPQRSETSAFRHEIKPGKIAEECLNLQPGDRLRYRFEASAPVPFNVHFHRGNSVEYPVNIDKTSNEASIFAAQSAEEFCWMWTNGTPDAVVVRGELIRTK